MVNVQHIQYPVGQGGLHLGIIGDYAYIYDCGGYGHAQWKVIFNDINSKTKGINKLDIFISHLHYDHFNKLSELLNNISFNKQKIAVYLPFMSDWEKVILIVGYFLKNPKLNSDKKQKYIDTILYNTFTDEYRDIKIIPIKHSEEYTNTFFETHLKTYVTNINQTLIDDFKKESRILGIDIENPLSQIDTDNSLFWKQVKQAFKNIFGTNYSVNQIMLNLYCGVASEKEYCLKKQTSWLHTGDAYMKECDDLMGYYNHFNKLLSFIDYVQVPHHGSENNHNDRFSFLFGLCHPCVFYYTTKSKNTIKENTRDLALFPCQIIKKVSDNSLTIISV